ncbi:conserved Plasmodium membrane protein, unknown function [Plasmodium sp. gorilla clade G1]|nr:conserved Plasmodium membrane protein, unknown function [Plasmodium sp. gorilla clade G1]
MNEEIFIPKQILSISAFAFTIIFIIITIFHEYKYVTYSKELRPIIKNAIPVSCIPLEENNGKIIHINCPLQDLETFYAPAQFSSNIYSFRGVFFEIKIEMYQWIRSNRYLGLYARGKFMDHIVSTPSNFLFFYKTPQNPTYFPSIGNIGRKYANYAKAGSYRLSKNSLINFQKKKKLELVDDGWFTESEIKPPFTVDHLNTNVFNDYLYTGDPLNPQVGDIRVSFYGNASTHATVIGVQTSRLLNSIFEIEGVNLLKRNIVLVSEENRMMINKTKHFINKNYGNITSLWFFRIITYLILCTEFYYILIGTSNNLMWRIAVSCSTSSIILTIFPCVFWIFCDTAIFLFLLIFLFIMSLFLLYIYNTEIEKDYKELKNYMKKPVRDTTNYTFLNVTDTCTGAYEEFNYGKNKVNNNNLESNSDVSYTLSLSKHPGGKFESSPAYI